MILRDIYLDMDRLRYSTEIAYPFKLRSRCLCNFVGRYVWKKQIRISGFNRISITVAAEAVPQFEINVCKVACISIPIADLGYQHLAGADLQEFYIECLLRASRQFLQHYPDALAAIEEGIDLFRSGEYRNEWIARSRRFAVLKMSAVLICSMTVERFTLRLTIQKGKEPVYDQEIFTSDPDEFAFACRFDDVRAADGKITVTTRYSKPLVALSLADLKA